VVADYSGAKPEVSDYKLALDQHYENVTEGKQLLVPDVLRRVAAENLGPALARLVPGDFGRAFGDTAREAAKSGEAALKDAGAQATDLLRGLREKLEEKKTDLGEAGHSLSNSRRLMRCAERDVKKARGL